jgi:hypothetical protein
MSKTPAQRFGWLRDPIGGFSFLLWLASFQLTTWLRDNGYQGLSDVGSGFVLGFATALSGWVLAHLWKGRWSKFVDSHPLWKWFSILSLVGIVLFGFIGALIDVFANTSGYFNVGFWISAFAMGACFGPMIDEIEGL